jgi:hypothetical protein
MAIRAYYKGYKPGSAIILHIPSKTFRIGNSSFFIYSCLVKEKINIKYKLSSLTLISLAEVRNYLAFFDGLILKNLFTVKNLSFELFLP